MPQGSVKPTKATSAESAIPFLGSFDAWLSHAQSLAGTASIRRAVCLEDWYTESLFQRCVIDDPIPGAMPQAQACTAPLALKMYVITDHGPLTHLPRP